MHHSGAGSERRVPRHAAARVAAPLFALALALLLPRGGAAEALQEQAERLAGLRAEVERLEQEIETEQVSQRERQQQLGAQRAELELLLQRDRASEQALLQDLERSQARSAALQRQQAALGPALGQALAALRAWIQRSLPFRRGERLAALAELERGLAAGKLGPAEAFSGLWALLEDELKLCGDSGLQQQVVEIDGEERLAEVARIGMALMFYRSPDGHYGRLAAGAQGEPVAVPLTDPAQTAALRQLFDGLRKGIRHGLYELPAPEAGDHRAEGVQ